MLSPPVAPCSHPMSHFLLPKAPHSISHKAGSGQTHACMLSPPVAPCSHPMNYFLLPKALNSQFNARGVLFEEVADRGCGRVMVPKKQVVGLRAFHTAVSFHR